MAPRTRRTQALTREHIVSAAVDLLDTAGEAGLTFRALSERLATGPGAIYWHVAGKGELLDAATDAVVAVALGAEVPDSPPQDRIRAVALGLFDAIDEHPWVATQLSASSWQATRPRIFESLGRHVAALGVARGSGFVVTSVLMQYVLGAAAQNAANRARARLLPPEVDREAFLAGVAATWEALDAEEYPFTRSVADELREHDDREQFLTGIDLILRGLRPRA